MSLNYNLIADTAAFTFIAWFSYVVFSMSQLFRIQYIERMGNPTARLTTKFFEYLTLFVSGVLLVSLSDYHGIIYYVGDGILLGFLARQFIKSDQLQRREYLRRYQTSKHKLVNRMITSTAYFPILCNN